MTNAPTQKHVFMSYSRTDEAVMQRVVEFLRKQGIKVWVDNEKLVPGTPIWEEEIEKAIIGAGAVVVLLSPDSKKSPWVRREISYAEDNEVRIFPILIAGDEKTAVPIRLTNHQRIDIRQNEEVGLHSIHTALLSYLEIREYQESWARVEATEIAARREEELEVARKVARHKAEHEAAEKATREKAAIEKVVREAAEKAEQGNSEKFTGEKAKSETEMINSQEEVGSKTTESIKAKWLDMLWITIGWSIGWTIGWAIGWSLGYTVGFVTSWTIGWAIGGYSITLTLKRKKNILTRISKVMVVLGWTIGGVIGNAIAYSLTYPLNIIRNGALALAFGGAIGSLATTLVLRRESGLAITKMLWIIIGWTFSVAIGGIITGNFDTNFWFIRGAPGGAIAGALGGIIMIWQLRK